MNKILLQKNIDWTSNLHRGFTKGGFSSFILSFHFQPFHLYHFKSGNILFWHMDEMNEFAAEEGFLINTK